MRDLNQIILDNQATIITFGLPILALLVGIFGHFLVHRSKSDEIRLAGRIKLADFRKENYDELKDKVSKLQGLIGLQLRRKVWKPDEVTSDQRVNEFVEIIQLGQDVMARIRTDSNYIEKFSNSLGTVLDILHGKISEVADEHPVRDFRGICHEILKAEWDQIEAELKRLA